MHEILSETDLAFWKEIEETEFLFEKECYKTCSSFCCRWDHEDFPRFLIPKGGTLFYLPKEMIYIKKYGKLPDKPISELYTTLSNNIKINIYYTACNDDNHCNINFSRTLYCRLYPFFPVFNIHGELLNLKYISIYDITSDLINLKTPCYIKNKKSEYIDKWKNDKNIHRLFTNPYLLFHFLVADILHDNYVETIKDSTLLENEGEMFWRLWEKAYLKKQLINKVKLVNKLDEMYNNFTNIYGSEFLK